MCVCQYRGDRSNGRGRAWITHFVTMANIKGISKEDIHSDNGNLSRELLSSEDVLLPSVSRYSQSISLTACPDIQHHPKVIDMMISTQLNPTSYIESKAYNASFEVEFNMIGKLENLIAVGHDFISYLYAYRSLSKALPEINIGLIDDLPIEEKNELLNKRNEINKKVFDIMKPTIIKLKELVSFVSTSITQFYQCILHLLDLQSKNLSVPSDFNDTIIDLLDVLIKLDNLKDMKPSVQNDFSRYKRALGGQFTGEIMEELTRIQNFLTSPQDPRFSKNYIFLMLRNEVKNIAGHEDILFDMLMFTHDKYESSLFLTPNDKFQILRVIPYFLWMIDGNGADSKSTNVFKQFKSKLGPIQKLCRGYPIVPLYGDMTVGTLFILERCDHFERSTMTTMWGSSGDDINEARYDIVSAWDSLKKSHLEYTNRLAMMLLTIKSSGSFTKSNEEKNIKLAKRVCDVMIDGLLTLSSYNCMLKLYFAWKYTHPASPSQLVDIGGDATSDDTQNSPGFEYAKAVRYNISKEDTYILVEMVGMVKSLSSLISEAEPDVAPIIRFHAHHSIQQLIQVDMIPLLHRVDKKNKKSLLNELLQIRHVAADWMFGVEPRDDYKASSGVSKSKFPSRLVSASPAQYRMLRSLVHSIYDERSSARRKEGLFFSRTELRGDDVSVFEKFYKESFFFRYLLDISGTLREVGDIGDLWYREFYLELAKCIQVSELLNECVMQYV